ncbi:ABC transporter substrate-binding protein [Planomonospora parontospora]|uniref:ABC transporter substrate-binding protein n=1 Tax=Planomonospora parontospora TaxID=58119 RepID=UPI0016703C59|nr:ABC transporter substrate-binding protein [Planomonospora parontospora]GGL37647.1 lipoprotein [Planomonospora parontospora subsp. antibiotica]GII17561.1 lipoprotein [Planomonospora parontospora subsp. antibiotica]
MTGRRPASLLLALLVSGALAACGGTPAGDAPAAAQAAAAPAGFPVTLDNCGVRTTYERPPRRAISMNQHATEVMLALGLEKSMIGTAYLDDKVLPEYQAAYDAIKVVAKEYPAYEALLAEEPDFVYGGFASTFDEKEGRGRDVLHKAGIKTYLNVEECAKGPVAMELMDTEIRNVAKIFGVPGRAEPLLTELHTALSGVREKLAGAAPVKLFVYDSGDRTAFTAGGKGIGNEIITLAGAENIFADLDKVWGDVSFEQVAERAPDWIVIYDYGSQSVEAKKKFLLDNPALKDVPAIKNKRFAVLPLSSVVLGVRAPGAVEALAGQLHADRFE